MFNCHLCSVISKFCCQNYSKEVANSWNDSSRFLKCVWSHQTKSPKLIAIGCFAGSEAGSCDDQSFMIKVQLNKWCQMRIFTCLTELISLCNQSATIDLPRKMLLLDVQVSFKWFQNSVLVASIAGHYSWVAHWKSGLHTNFVYLQLHFAPSYAKRAVFRQPMLAFVVCFWNAKICVGFKDSPKDCESFDVGFRKELLSHHIIGTWKWPISVICALFTKNRLNARDYNIVKCLHFLNRLSTVTVTGLNSRGVNFPNISTRWFFLQGAECQNQIAKRRDEYAATCET